MLIHKYIPALRFNAFHGQSWTDGAVWLVSTCMVFSVQQANERTVDRLFRLNWQARLIVYGTLYETNNCRSGERPKGMILKLVRNALYVVMINLRHGSTLWWQLNHAEQKLYASYFQIRWFSLSSEQKISDFLRDTLYLGFWQNDFCFVFLRTSMWPFQIFYTYTLKIGNWN